MAEPGSVCVAAIVAEHLQTAGGFAVADLGEHKVKNIERPIRVFRVAMADAPDTPAELRLVKDGFEQAARGAGRDDGIAHALDFHFRASEAGEVAPSAEVDSHG